MHTSCIPLIHAFHSHHVPRVMFSFVCVRGRRVRSRSIMHAPGKHVDTVKEILGSKSEKKLLSRLKELGAPHHPPAY